MEAVPDSIKRTAGSIAERIASLPTSDSRLMVAIAGPPGAGKSTLASEVVEVLVKRGLAAVLMPMDGFHLDDRLLGPRGLQSRKGAPETFDFDGFAHALRRVRSEGSVILPIFDRSKEIAVAGAVEIQTDTSIVVIEGNYLLLDEDPWRELAPLWDLSVFIDVPVEELERRLIERWLAHEYTLEAARAWISSNDLPNAKRVCRAVGPSDLIVGEEGILKSKRSDSGEDPAPENS